VVENPAGLLGPLKQDVFAARRAWGNGRVRYDHMGSQPEPVNRIFSDSWLAIERLVP